jgi:asparagine synthase (glutamine-hydrolysing)
MNASPSENILFGTSSDSEAILEAFSKYGPAFVDKLNGMFVIVIYDKQTRELFLFRDRIGIKPLYYYWDGKNFAFASELKSLALLKQIPHDLHKGAIRSFLHLGYVPTPVSIYKAIHKLDSGCYMKVSENNMQTYRYWNIPSKLQPNVMEDKRMAMVKLSDLLISSVQYQLKSDVPFGIFLSGGIDSSLVTAHAVELSSVKVNTFSIGFEESRYDESQYARKVANYLGTSHHEFIVSYKDAIPLVDKMINIYDEPFADSSAIPTMLVSKLAKQHVTVVLSGEGGDELFFGYGFYKWAKRLNNPLVKLFHKPIGYALDKIPNNRYKRGAMLFEYSNLKNIRSHIFSQEQYYFSEEELGSLLTDDYNKDDSLIHHINSTLLASPIQHTRRHFTMMERQAIFDIYYYLKDDLLTKVDRASMQYAVETRVPYLDHRIVEFALNLSPHLKYNGQTTKYILKQILYQYVPKQFFERKKQGFSIPMNLWLTKELKYLVDDYLNKSIIEQYGIVNYEEVQKLKADFFTGKNYIYNRLWLLIVLHKWLTQSQVET